MVDKFKNFNVGYKVFPDRNLRIFVGTFSESYPYQEITMRQ